MEDDGNQNVLPTNADNAQDDDAVSEASDTSRTTDQILRDQVDDYEANNPDDFRNLAAAYGRQVDGQQTAIVSPQQARSISTRPLSVPRLHLRATPSSVAPPAPQPTYQPAYLPATPPVPQPPSSSTFSFTPSFTFTQELPSSDEIGYEVPAHQRPLPDAERRVIDNLSNGQRCHLLERWRPEIAAESRPIHREEFRAEMEEEKEAAKEKCEAEKARLRQRAEKAEDSASEALATVESLKDQVKTLERGSRAAFSKGEEKGAKEAVAGHATRWSNMEEQLADKEKRLQIRQDKLEEEQKSLASAQAAKIDALTAQVAAHEETIAAQANGYDQMEKEGMAYVAELKAQLHDKEEEAKRVRAELVTCAGSLQQQLAETTRLQNQLGPLQNQLGHLQAQFGLQQLSHQAAMDGGVREWRRRELTLARSYSLALRQLQMDHQEEQHHLSGAPKAMGRDVSELTTQISALHIGPHSRPATRPCTPEPLPATDRQQLEQDLADQRAANEDLRIDLETVRLDLADCQETIKRQPPVDDCPARLRDQQARLETKCAQRLGEQEARLMEEVRAAAQVFRAEKEAELAKAVAEAEEEKRRMERAISGLRGDLEAEGEEKMRMERVVSGLRRDLEASQAKLERQFEASQAAEGTIQSLREEKRALGQRDWELTAANRELRASFDRFDQNRRRQSAQTDNAIRSKERAERKVGEARAQVGALEEENRALGAKYAKLDEQHSAAKTRLARALVSLDRQRIQSEDLTADLERVRERLAKSEGARKKGGDEIHDRERSMEERLDEWEMREQAEEEEAEREAAAAAEEVKAGEREMDAPLGVPEKAKEGLLGPQAPRWKRVLFWLLVGLLLVLALLAASADNRREVVLGEDPSMDLLHFVFFCFLLCFVGSAVIF